MCIYACDPQDVVNPMNSHSFGRSNKERYQPKGLATYTDFFANSVIMFLLLGAAKMPS